MAELKGLLHLADSGATRPVALSWDEAARVLCVTGDGADLRVAASALTVSTGGWQGTAIHLVWESEGRPWAVTVTDAHTIEALSGALSAVLAGQLERAIADRLKASRRGNRTLGVLLVVVLLGIGALVAAWMLRDSIVDGVVRRLPPAVDRQLGELAVAELSRSDRLVSDGPAREAVRSVGARLAAAEPAPALPFRFELARDASVNAYAAPGGLIVVHTGLLRSATSADELAGVLAHEMTHVTERHTLRQVVFYAGFTRALRLMVGSPEGAAEMLAGAARNLTALRFSREQEAAADRGALERLERAQLSGAGLVSFFDRLARGRGALPPFLSSHPAAAERAAALLDAMDRRRGRAVDPLVLDWAAVQADAVAVERGAATPGRVP